ncbi:MAG: cytochrome c [Pseudomonadota bacterium]
MFRQFLIGAAALSTVATLSILPAAADEAMEKAVKARQGLFQVYAFNLGQLGAMAKGKVEFDAEAAQNAADNLLAATSMKGGAMWPQGSDNTGAMKGKTRAKAEAWTTWPAIAKNSEDMVVAAKALAENAGTLDGIKANIADVGQACKACHEKYRAKDF